jgi:hypothetical protein
VNSPDKSEYGIGGDAIVGGEIFNSEKGPVEQLCAINQQQPFFTHTQP